MERIKPMLGEIELQQVQQLNIDADQVLTEHSVPALEGNFFQSLGRRGTKIILSGVVSGAESGEGLKKLREQFRSVEPVSFVSDIISATDLDQVLIEDMEVTEVAGKPNRFEYAFTLREFTAPPEQPTEPPPVVPPPPAQTATLVVEVIVDGNPDFDFSRASVTVRGTQQDDTDLFRPLTNRTENIWTEEDFPAGQYRVEAVVLDTPQMTGNVDAEVRDGETTRVRITLRSGTVIAKTFMIHFRFDSAFAEPCMLHVLKQVNEFAAAHTDHKLLILGHTDLAGSRSYNQSLSERRARSAFSVLRFGNDNQAAIDEWNAIRRTRSSGVSLGDSWGAREYQQMLQDLSFYNGLIDGNHGPKTDDAVKRFQTQQGLTDTGNVDDATWPVLIREYLAQHNLSIADSQFLPNCEGEILKWLGCGELDPVRDVDFAWRPNRRTEFLFVQTDSLPRDVAQPDTFNLPTPGAVNSNWCLNNSGVSTRCCFVKPHVPPGKETCAAPTSPGASDQWQREAAEPQPTFVVRGSIKFEDGTPFANGRYTLIAPDGEFMDGEVPTSTSTRRAGTGTKGTTQADGSFEYVPPSQPPPEDKRKRPGIFTLEVDGDFVARIEGQPIEEAKGPVVCKRLATDTDRLHVIIIPSALANVRPTITAPPIVVVKKTHTSPQRQPVVLSVNQTFSGEGLFTRSPDDRVKFFTAASGGTSLQFNGVDNLFTGAALFAGVTLFAEGGPNHSVVINDITLKLQLSIGGQAGFSDSAQMTSVEITLDISEPRTAPNVDPPLLSATDKATPGRFVLPQNANFDRPRAILTVQPPKPLIPNDLELSVINAQLQLFSVENPRSPTPPQTALTNPQTLPTAAIPATGTQFFIGATGVSTSFRDTGFQLGITAIEADGDRVAVTVLNSDPSQPGLFNVGEHEYTEADEGSFDLPRSSIPGAPSDDADIFDPFPAGTPIFSVRRRAVVRYPADVSGSNVAVSTEQSSYPLVVILHGNHGRFLSNGNFVESYRGLEYLCRHLASHGYIALTIDVDDINQRRNAIFHRGVAVLEHVNIMKNRNATAPTVAGIVDFSGKINESHILLIGHSRGGEGVLAAENINQVKSQGHDIKGVISIAPTNFTNRVHNTTPYLVIYGSSDGDVSGAADGVNPFLIYDRAAPPKAMIFAYAAIHNRFSTNADWLSFNNIDNDDARILSESDHQNIAKGYSAAFFEQDIRGPIGFDTFFKNYEKPASVNAVELHQQVQDPTTLVIDNFDQVAPVAGRPLLRRLADRATTNTLGNAVSQTGLVRPDPSLLGNFRNALTETQLTNDFIEFFIHDGVGAMIAWNSSGDTYQSTLNSQDASAFKVLSFRVTQRFGSTRNPANTVQNFSVRLTDSAGEAATLLISSVTDIPFPFERHDHVALHGPLPVSRVRFVDRLPDSPDFNKSALKTIRLSLENFVNANTNLNLAALEQLDFIYNQTTSGEIAIDNIEFSN